MGKKVRSVRGEMVDFDLMQIKKQIAAQPAPLEVKARQDFIENRLKRRIKKAQNIVDESKDVVAPTMPAPAETVDETHIEAAVQEPVEALTAVDAEMVDIEAPSATPAKEEQPVKKRTTKQKARPKPSKD